MGRSVSLVTVFFIVLLNFRSNLKLQDVVVVEAQDPLYARHASSSSSSWQQPPRAITVAASTRPWRQGRRRYQQQQRRPSNNYNPATPEELSSRILDATKVQNDPRARPWKVDVRQHRSNMRGKRMSWTARIIWTTAFTFLLQTVQPQVTQWGLKLSEPLLKGQQLYRLVTPIFLHGGMAHIGMNMMSLSRVGNDMERLFGPGRFVSTYLLSGVAGNICSAYQSPNPGLGASGAVFGVIGAYFVFLNRNEWLLGPSASDMTSNIASTMLFNVFLGLMNPVIDNWAHLGGAIGGASMAYYFGPRLYLSVLPNSSSSSSGSTNGSSSSVQVIDRPILRLPRQIEEIPENFARQMERISRRMRIEGVMSDLPERPWRRRRQQQQQRLNAPTRSVKPGPVD